MTRSSNELISGVLPLVVLLATLPGIAVSAQAQYAHSQLAETRRARYDIYLVLDFENRSYTGSERVRWFNRGEKPASVIYFHLYPNLRSPDQASADAAGATDEPRLEVQEVTDAAGALLWYSLDDQGATLRVNLRAPIPANGSTELRLKFKGSVPEIDPEETGLATHVVKQVGAALRSERETRRARDINFRCRGVIFLGTAFPVLAVREGDDWRRKLEPSVGDIVFNEAADYEVAIETEAGVAVFTPGRETPRPAEAGNRTRTFLGAALRDFAILAGHGLRSEQTEVEGVTVRSVFLAEHERVGKRVLSVAANALRAFTDQFGSLPFGNVTIAEAPLVAGLGSSEYSGFNVIASAFYVDFDSPAMRNLPEIIREQRPAVEESLEWTVAHLVAHQWWGAAVGNDPLREPVLDEALSCWSALLYYHTAYGEERAAAALEDQVRGVYRLYRTFGGEDMDANRPARDYRNTFQYAAIVTTKGALMFVELERLLGRDKLINALRNYYKANLFEIAELDDLRGALIAESPIEQRRAVARTFVRWLSARRGDEDISPPDAELAASLGISSKPPQKGNDRNAFTPFARLGKFFWQQMTRIR